MALSLAQLRLLAGQAGRGIWRSAENLFAGLIAGDHGAIAIGTYTGNASTQIIALGFVPDFVEIENVTDGNKITRFFRGMTAATADQISGVAGESGVRIIASGGITTINNATTKVQGFQVDVTTSPNAKVMRYIAIKGGAWTPTTLAG